MQKMYSDDQQITIDDFGLIDGSENSDKNKSRRDRSVDILAIKNNKKSSNKNLCLIL